MRHGRARPGHLRFSGFGRVAALPDAACQPLFPELCVKRSFQARSEVPERRVPALAAAKIG